MKEQYSIFSTVFYPAMIAAVVDSFVLFIGLLDFSVIYDILMVLRAASKGESL